ncbi:MAG: Eco57I restriction-modification methylase domain-containing protein [Thermoleophilia bacterium]
MAKFDPQIAAHQEWIGFVQPTGLVVSPTALVRAGAILDSRDAEGQRLLRACTEEREFHPGGGAQPWIPDFRAFAASVLGWTFSPKGYAGTAEAPIPPELEVALVDFEETLRPDFAVREPKPADDGSPWQLLVRVLQPGQPFDKAVTDGGQLEASPHGRMERLLRQTGVPAGLLFNGVALRLISAPRGESSGWMDFRVADMVKTAGRPICTALRLLLGQMRLLNLPQQQRFAALLEDSRKYQNEVSERLAEQVLHALYELLRGFQAAHDASKGELLHEQLREHPDEVYRGLLTVLLRLVFLLYAEERDMLPEDETYLRHYSLGGLYERLREDAALFPDTMDQRYGAWPQLLTLFRLVYDGADAGSMRLPRRHGVLFDPDRFSFLEGRPPSGARQTGERLDPPLVPDGTVFRALEKLLVLDGERISYRALDVEQIGSVYETMMGFRLQTATGRSVAIRSTKRLGAPVTVDLDELLAEAPNKREKWLRDAADRTLGAGVKQDLKEATQMTDLHAALAPVVDQAATPDLVSPGAMILQPSEERRRSGSHYTPRSLTEPIVRTTLEPILEQLRDETGSAPTPDQILELKVCDPAMGSGAFLVEACRQLGDTLIASWAAHGGRPDIPSDEDEVVFARRLIAQRCLYGVDRNPVAVDLAKMSLWLVTLARDHALTFVDHALRHGDSLVGLSLRQIEAFHWDPKAPGFESVRIREHLERAAELRELIRDPDEAIADWELRSLWDEAQHEMRQVKLYGDLAVAAFFEADKPKERQSKRDYYGLLVTDSRAEEEWGRLEAWRNAELPLVPFHWEVEFPEVFARANPGFDAFIGNPPFMGGSKISTNLGGRYLDWLLTVHAGSHGNGDLVAHFFRTAIDRTRQRGTLGLIATNTIAQGDTRSTGLHHICTHGGTIYSVRRRLKWPGLAAVIVSVVHIFNGEYDGRKSIDGIPVKRITAFLSARGGDDSPRILAANSGLSFYGSKVYGKGFIFDDIAKDAMLNSISDMEAVLYHDSNSAEVIFPYIGGAELYTSPIHKHHRYVINFAEMTLEEAQAWPALYRIVADRVLPERRTNNRESRRKYWWRFGESTPALYRAARRCSRVLAVCVVGPHISFAFLSSNMVYAESLIIIPLETYHAFCTLQSRPHELWARFFGSSMKDDSRYTPSDCFETFPLPPEWTTHPTLEVAGQTYYDFRAALMVRNDEGLTKTYNRFHDPEERDPDILKLRELHAAMDRAVLDAYGWTDIPTDCEFLLDYEIDEDEWGKKKKPYRYRWPDDVRDEVLARLLELNAQRAAEEARAGVGTGTSKKRATKRGTDQGVLL